MPSEHLAQSVFDVDTRVPTCVHGLVGGLLGGGIMKSPEWMAKMLVNERLSA